MRLSGDSLNKVYVDGIGQQWLIVGQFRGHYIGEHFNGNRYIVHSFDGDGVKLLCQVDVGNLVALYVEPRTLSEVTTDLIEWCEDHEDSMTSFDDAVNQDGMRIYNKLIAEYKALEVK